jgi:hypothetical protein
MTIITTMARFLDAELQARGVSGLSHDDSADILRAVIDRTVEVAEKAIVAACLPSQPKEPT